MRHHPTAKQVKWLLVDLCEKAGFSMAIRDSERFESLVVNGPDALTDAVLAAEGLAPDVEQQKRRELRAFVAARYARWELEGVVERERSANDLPAMPPDRH